MTPVPSMMPQPSVTPERTASYHEAPQGPTDLQSVERALIEKALADARFNKSQAAKVLGLTRAQLYVRLRKHGLE